MKKKYLIHAFIIFSLLIFFQTGISCKESLENYPFSKGKAVVMNANNSTNTKLFIDENEDIIILPPPYKEGKMSVEQALWKRKSQRRFSSSRLDNETIGQLLWAAQGINRPERGFRTCPSAGATFPLITYAMTQQGVYRYYPDGHRIRKIISGDRRLSLSQAALEQKWVETAPLNIIFTAIPDRTSARYGSRGSMYVHMEAGHAAQNIHLQAVALGLGSVPVGAFIEARVTKIIGSTEMEVPLYIIPVGYPEGE